MILTDARLSRLRTTLKDKILLGNEPTPELFAILTVYFVQGILGLARLAVSFFLKDELGLSPAQTAAMMGIAAIPWTIKPLFGFLSDGLPLFGYRRRPYLILGGLLGTWSWIALGTVVNDPWTATVAILFTSLSVAISDVIVDSLIVERVHHESIENAGSLQSLTWGTSALGGLITAYLSGWLLQQLSSQTVFLITASFPLLVAGVAALIAEEPLKGEETAAPAARVKDQIRQLWGGLRQKAIWLPTAFVFIWQATPNSGSALFYFTTNELGFQPEFLGRVRLVTSVAALIGVGVYQRFLRSVPFRKILGWTTVFSSALGMTTLILVTHANRAMGIDDRWFSLGDSLILTVMGQIAFMPVLVLSARLCPPGVEATFFALLMSILNLAGLVSHEGGALLTHWLGITETQFDRLWLLVVIANLSSLLPLPFLHWLPDGEDGEVQRPVPPAQPLQAASEALTPVEPIVAQAASETLTPVEPIVASES
ncbi:MAG: folate/biopterin family MFS transporter [Cyanobacteriota bacterium]|nr:folate/biopterin family MFS transporter [Cyanobacteriota bacterium]